MSPGSSPPMREASLGSHSRENSASHPQYFYPTIPSVQQPPSAYINHAKRMSETQRTDTTRVQSSISSGESGSSAFSYQKQYPTQQTFWQPPSPEQVYVDADPDRNRSHWDKKEHQSSRRSIQRPEMSETHPSVIRYIQEQQRIEAEDEEEEDDHALWVLVSDIRILVLT